MLGIVACRRKLAQMVQGRSSNPRAKEEGRLETAGRETRRFHRVDSFDRPKATQILETAAAR
jgi:hypothetical protein